MPILDLLKPQVDATIASLAAVEFRPDPIAGTLFSRMVSVLSSAYKRHGAIIENAILRCLTQSDRYEVWRVDRFGVQQQAKTTVAAAGNPSESSGRFACRSSSLLTIARIAKRSTNPNGTATSPARASGKGTRMTAIT